MTPRPAGHVHTLPGFVLLVAVLVGLASADAARLDRRITVAIERSTSVVTQRLLDEVTREWEEPTAQRLGDPMGDARICDIAWRDTLLRALRSADFSGPTRVPSQACTCYAEIRVQFWSDSSRAMMRLCYLCGEVGVVLGRSRADHFAQAGSFGSGARSFVRFVRAHYADDERLMEIVDRAYPIRER